jgi:hypothetical protein
MGGNSIYDGLREVQQLLFLNPETVVIEGGVGRGRDRGVSYLGVETGENRGLLLLPFAPPPHAGGHLSRSVICCETKIIKNVPHARLFYTD